jgi:hypothetical protein
MAKGVTVVFSPALVQKQVIAGMVKRFKVLGEHLKNRHIMELSVPVVKARKKRRRTTSRGTKGSSYTYAEPDSRSKPGEYPRAETGELRRNTFSEVSLEIGFIKLEVGTSKKYGEMLETKMDRKGLRATLISSMPDIRKILLTNQMENAAFMFTKKL